ncbi:tRNA preQ1(34) S-adenosylmethionine ribosyltransferase-isomerase QueA [Terrarubrum flagellatum]|uniref:tRNA preQ1(34) S-adenosylmethionine ribosyltransferase-isomerase QueA n=1 Tax=Terrirubrum flagellatum TaxID=2895980 RepID=UPI0031450685
MLVSDFDFHLPEDRIALRPMSPRDRAKMLVVRPDADFEDRIVADLPAFLRPGDALVVNDTRVIPARLDGVRRRASGEGARIEALLMKREAGDVWRALARPGKRLAVGDRIRFGEGEGNACLLGSLDATVEEKFDGGEILLRFDLSGPDLDIAIATAGRMPLPPYIAGKRAADQKDVADYQTMYAERDGAVAAPTAGLHFTPRLLAALDKSGVSRHVVTLHVGGGTFLPMKVEDTRDHRMHPEWGEVSAKAAQALNETRANGGRIIAVGTTSLRLLESAATEDGTIRAFAGETDIFITPGYRFRAADLLMTNFHLPKSTLFMLVCAFAGTGRMKSAYQHAIHHNYRFYSYGDSSLLHRA